MRGVMMVSRKSIDVFRLAAAIELFLVLCESSFAGSTGEHGLLPLGGGHIQQIGLCFGLAYVLNEVRAVFWPPDA